MRIRFGEFVFDSEMRRILRANQPTDLSPKAFDLLEILLQKRPRAMSKKELIDSLWPTVVVEEENLKARIHEIRVAVGERWIRTVHRFGYAFEGEAFDAEASPEAPYWIECGTRGFPVGSGETIIGRDPRCQIWIDDASISRKHARIVVTPAGVTIEDLGSKNGTALGRIPVNGVAELCSGDRIRVGSVKLLFRSAPEVASTRTTPSPD